MRGARRSGRSRKADWMFVKFMTLTRRERQHNRRFRDARFPRAISPRCSLTFSHDDSAGCSIGSICVSRMFSTSLSFSSNNTVHVLLNTYHPEYRTAIVPLTRAKNAPLSARKSRRALFSSPAAPRCRIKAVSFQRFLRDSRSVNTEIRIVHWRLIDNSKPKIPRASTRSPAR